MTKKEVKMTILSLFNKLLAKNMKAIKKYKTRQHYSKNICQIIIKRQQKAPNVGGLDPKKATV